MIHDARYALRQAIRNPGLTAIAILALALGIGANTAIFSVVNGVLLRPLPFPDPDRLMMVWGSNPRVGLETASWPDYCDWRDQNHSFETLAGMRSANFNVSSGDTAERLLGARVTANFFRVLGVKPAQGRDFTADDDRHGAPRVAILGHHTWQRLFGGEPVLGKTMRLDAELYTVIGVAPPDFRFPSDSAVWTPQALEGRRLHRRNDFLQVIGRLKPGITRQQAQTDLTAIAARLEKEYPQTNTGWTAALVPLHEQTVKRVRPALLMLLGAVGLVLLIACANIANLLLARAAARQREIAVRCALGAGAGRLLRQFLTESVLLGVAGGGLGVMLAAWGVDLLKLFAPSDIPRLPQVNLDAGVLLFTLGVSVTTGLLFGLAPAVEAVRRDFQASLREGGRGTTGARGRVRAALVVGEMALAVVLVTGAGLLLRSLWNLQSLDAGFHIANLLTMRLTLAPAQYPEEAQQTAFFGQLLERVRTLPGVRGASLINALPVDGGGPMLSFDVQGAPPPALGQEPDANLRLVDHLYFRTMGIPLRKGREFTAQDRAATNHVAIINEKAAGEFWPHEDPIGKRVFFRTVNGQPDWLEIVGIVADVRHDGLEAGEVRAVYAPIAQQGWRAMTLVVRNAGDTGATASAVRAALRELDPHQPVFAVRSMDEILGASLALRRFNLGLLAAFAALALALAMVGIYGVMSYAVSQRTPEIGMRLALGARPAQVLGMVLVQGLWLAAAGAALGTALAFLLRPLALPGETWSGAILVMVPMLLAAVAALACWLPARRASRVDPLVALRYE